MKLTDKTSPTRWTEYGINGNEVTIQHKEKTDFLEQEIRMLREGRNDSELGRHLAKIPLTIYTELGRQGILGDKERFRKWLNDPDNKVWRVAGGKV